MSHTQASSRMAAELHFKLSQSQQLQDNHKAALAEAQQAIKLLEALIKQLQPEQPAAAAGQMFGVPDTSATASAPAQSLATEVGSCLVQRHLGATCQKLGASLLRNSQMRMELCSDMTALVLPAWQWPSGCACVEKRLRLHCTLRQPGPAWLRRWRRAGQKLCLLDHAQPECLQGCQWVIMCSTVQVQAEVSELQAVLDELWDRVDELKEGAAKSDAEYSSIAWVRDEVKAAMGSLGGAEADQVAHRLRRLEP